MSIRTFRRLAVLNTVMLTGIIATGAAVRLTGSGLGCRHWPGCQPGAILPAHGIHSDVEFTNRALAALTIMVGLVTFISVFLTPGIRRATKWFAGIAGLGTILQAPLGAITVYYDLNPWLVISHFILSLIVLPFAVWVTLDAFEYRGEALPKNLRYLALLVAVACWTLLLSGTLATAAGKHSGSADIRRIGSLDSAVWLHVRATALFGISFFVLLTFLIARRSAHTRVALLLLGVLTVQMVIGEIQYHNQLPWGLVLVHVAISAMVWTTTVIFVGGIWRPKAVAT